MEIPTGEITADFYAGRVQRIVSLQKRWQGWVQQSSSNSGIERSASHRPSSALHHRGSSLDISSATPGGVNTAKRRPLSATSGIVSRQPRRKLNVDNNVNVSSTSDHNTTMINALGDMSAFSSQLESGDFQKMQQSRPVNPAQASPLSGLPEQERTHNMTLNEEHERNETGDELFRLSHFGVSVDEVASLKKLCDALKQLELASHFSTNIVDATKPQNSTNAGENANSPTGGVSPSIARHSNLSVEVALSALEAAAHVFSGHPLFQYFFTTLAHWLPKGVYSNALPLLAEASPLPAAGVEQQATTVVGNSHHLPQQAQRQSVISPTRARLQPSDNWVDWLVHRSSQWSSLCIPLGTISSVFDAARNRVIPTSSSNLLGGSDAGSRTVTSRGGAANGNLGQTLFSNTAASLSFTPQQQNLSEMTTFAATQQHRSSVVSCAFARLGGGTAPKVPKKVILRQHFTAWNDFVSSRRVRATWIRVCSKSANKDTLYMAFFKWKCETSISLAMRKTSHAERLHYVVQDDAKRISALEADVKNVTRQRDSALARVDQLMDDSKLAFIKTRDLQNNMVIDFRQPLYAINARRTTITATAAASDPIVSGVIYFDTQPPAMNFHRSALAVSDDQSSNAAMSPKGSTSSPRKHSLGTNHSTSPVSLPMVYHYDCGAERDVEGIAIPGSENYRSHYRIAVEGLTEKQLQSTPVDPLLGWVNDTVIEACGMLMGLDPSPPCSPTLASTASPQQVARAARDTRSSAPTTAAAAAARARRSVLQDFDAFEDLGAGYKEYLNQWQTKCQSWDSSSDTLREVSMSDRPHANRCVVSLDSRSRRLAPSVQMACHVSRPRDLSNYPFIYVLLLYRICPTLIQLYGPSIDDTGGGGIGLPTIQPYSADDWGSSMVSPPSTQQTPSEFAASLSFHSHHHAPGGAAASTSSLKTTLSLEEQVAILVRKSMKSIDVVYPLLHRAGLLQHLSLDLLAPSSSSAHDAGSPINPKGSDATHRLLVARMKAFSGILAAYQPFWEHHLKSAPFHRALSLPDIVVQRQGTNHANEIVLQELLAWVRSVLSDPSFTMQLPPPVESSDVASPPPAAQTSASSTLGMSNRQRPVELARDSSQRSSQPPAAAKGGPFAPTTAEAMTNGFSLITNVSENFGEGLELLWMLVWRLAPVNSLPMMHFVVDELRKPPPPARQPVDSAVTIDPLSTSTSSPAASLRSPPASPQNAKVPTSPARGAAKDRESPKSSDAIASKAPEDHFRDSGSSQIVEEPSVALPPPVVPPSVDALPIKHVAHLLCVTLRDAFGGHLPQLLVDELYLATPSLKALYLSCLYAAIHHTKTLLRDEVSTVDDSNGVSSPLGAKKASAARMGKSSSPAASPTSVQSLAGAFPPAGPTLFPNCLATVSSSQSLTALVDQCAPLSLLRGTPSDELFSLLLGRNEMLYMMFLKYATLGAPPLQLADIHETVSTGQSTSNAEPVDIARLIGIGVSFIGAELLARDILCAFIPPRSGPPTYLAASGEESSHALMAIRRSFFETLDLDPSQLPHHQQLSNNVGASAYVTDARIHVAQFGELLIRLCCMMSSSTFANLRKAVPPKASIMAYLPNFDPNQLIHRIKLLFFVIEEHVSSVAPAAEPVVVLGTRSPKKGVAAGTTAQQPSVAIMSPNAKAGAFASLRSSSSAWGRDSFLTMSSLALHFRRQSVVDPRVFREKCKMVVALFVKYSNWASSERWQVIEERRMSPQLFASLCTVTGILQSNGQSSANIRQVASKLPSLGWQSSSSDVSVTPAVATQEYARVSPVYDLLNTTVASASADRKAAKRMVSAIQRSKKGSPQDEKAVLHVKRCLLATSRGLDASMLRPLDPTLAAMIFSVISLSRSTSAAQAQNKVFQTTGAGAPGVDRHSATVDSEGFCEEDASEVLSSDTTLGFAGFCELIAFLADQCIAHPWLSTSARTALFVEYVYSVVFE